MIQVKIPLILDPSMQQIWAQGTSKTSQLLQMISTMTSVFPLKLFYLTQWVIILILHNGCSQPVMEIVGHHKLKLGTMKVMKVETISN